MRGLIALGRDGHWKPLAFAIPAMLTLSSRAALLGGVSKNETE